MKKRDSAGKFKFIASLNFFIAFSLIVLLRFFETESFTRWYGHYLVALERYEYRIENYGATFIAVAVIMINYLIKSFLPWFPISCLCVASAVIFKWYFAAVINLAGVAVFFTVRFYKGRKKGGGKAERLLERYDKPHRFMDSGKAGSKLLLFFARLIPGIPLGAVSVFYGSTKISYGGYLAVSLAGFLYKIMTYIVIGRNVFDPASVSFVGPFIPLLIMAGFVFLSVSGVLTVKNRNKRRSFFFKNKNKTGRAD